MENSAYPAGLLVPSRRRIGEAPVPGPVCGGLQGHLKRVLPLDRVLMTYRLDSVFGTGFHSLWYSRLRSPSSAWSYS